MNRRQLVALATAQAVEAWQAKWASLVGADRNPRLVHTTLAQQVNGLVAYAEVQWRQCKPRREKLADAMGLQEDRDLRTINDILALVRLLDDAALEGSLRQEAVKIPGAHESAQHATMASFDNFVECHLARPFLHIGVQEDTAIKLIRTIMQL